MRFYIFSKLFTFSAIFSLTAFTCLAVDEAYSDILNNKGQVIGNASYKQGTEGVVIRVKVKGLKAGVHGMHFHEVGDCSDYDNFERSGGHVSSHEKAHGFFNPDGPHEANLPNLIVARNGTAFVEIYTDLVSLSGQNWKPQLLDEDGTALIIHENEDDHYTQPTGNSGKRIACGIIGEKNLSSEENELSED
jgi:superoxide dismutase, Cu-Zn family